MNLPVDVSLVVLALVMVVVFILNSWYLSWKYKDRIRYIREDPYLREYIISKKTGVLRKPTWRDVLNGFFSAAGMFIGLLGEKPLLRLILLGIIWTASIFLVHRPVRKIVVAWNRVWFCDTKTVVHDYDLVDIVNVRVVSPEDENKWYNPILLLMPYSLLRLTFRDGSEKELSLGNAEESAHFLVEQMKRQGLHLKSSRIRPQPVKQPVSSTVSPIVKLSPVIPKPIPRKPLPPRLDVTSSVVMDSDRI